MLSLQDKTRVLHFCVLRASLVALFFLTLSRPLAAESIEFRGETMGTTYSVKLGQLPTGVDREQLQSEIDAELERINDLASTYRPDSELSRFNQSTSTDWYDVSAELALLVRGAEITSELTGGAFDATVAPLVNLWNFGPESNADAIPSDADVEAARRRVGYQKLQVRFDPPALRKSQPDVMLDLSASAKGYAAVKLSQLLGGYGVAGRLIEIGGEIQAVGTKADGQPWIVGIEAPTDGARTLQRTIALRDMALATSGDYRNFREIDGLRYSHMIDPRTGRPVEHSLASVSVAHASCEAADRMATALMVLGPGAGYDLATNMNLAALFIERTDGGFLEKTTPAFAKLLAAEESHSWIPVFIAAAIVFALAVTGMAVGVIFSNRRIRGSCGGLANLRDAQGNPMCEACDSPSPDCTGPESKQSSPAEQVTHKTDT